MFFKLEKELRPIVTRWMRNRGMDVLDEFHLIDLVGVQFGPRPTRRIPPVNLLIAVELKLHDVPTVIGQAESNHWIYTESFSAMPAERIKRMRAATLDKFKHTQTGLLSVHESGDVEILRPSAWRDATTFPEGQKPWVLCDRARIDRNLWY